MSDYISEDILALILKWVSVKTLLQVRSVCQGWKQIIDSPLFIRQHLSLQAPRFLLQQPHFILQSPECTVIDPHALPSIHKLNVPTQDHGYLFIGTHNGVVCLVNCFNSNLLLWNPSICKFFTIPIPEYRVSGWEYYVGVNCFGFWIDPCTKEYKFVIINSIMDKKGNPVGSVLYSSIQQDWKVIPAAELMNWVPDPPVMLNGVAHWRGNKVEDDAGIILSFDFVLERFDLIEMPDLKFSLDKPIHCHWRGNLSVVVRDRTSSDRFNVYLRQEGVWVNAFGFNLLPGMCNVLWVLCEEEERVRVLDLKHYELVLHDTRDGIICLAAEDYDDRVYSSVYVAYDFVESLLFPSQKPFDNTEEKKKFLLEFKI